MTFKKGNKISGWRSMDLRGKKKAESDTLKSLADSYLERMAKGDLQVAEQAMASVVLGDRIRRLEGK